MAQAHLEQALRSYSDPERDREVTFRFGHGTRASRLLRYLALAHLAARRGIGAEVARCARSPARSQACLMLRTLAIAYGFKALFDAV